MLRICWNLAKRRQVKALVRLNKGAIKALLRLNKGDITALLRNFKTELIKKRQVNSLLRLY